MQIFESNAPEETEQFAEQLAAKLLPGDVIAFRGGLGAGKTAFTRGLAKGLGVRDFVTSPTFAILNIYIGENMDLFHFDMYRVKGFDALYSTGFFDYLDNAGVIAVEWSENIQDELPGGAIFVEITLTGEQSRRIAVEGGGRF